MGYSRCHLYDRYRCDRYNQGCLILIVVAKCKNSTFPGGAESYPIDKSEKNGIRVKKVAMGLFLTRTATRVCYLASGTRRPVSFSAELYPASGFSFFFGQLIMLSCPGNHHSAPSKSLSGGYRLAIRSVLVVLRPLAGIDCIAVGMPGGMSDQRQEHDETDEECQEADDHEGHDHQAPQ